MSSSLPPPPYYILVAPSALGNHSHPSSLTHPTVQYHYADDPPAALLPSAEHPNVIILEPHLPGEESVDSTTNGLHIGSSSPPSVAISSAVTIVPSKTTAQAPSFHCLSSSAAVTNVRVAQPPASAVAFATNEGKDPNIYIIDYVPLKSSAHPEEGHRLEDSIGDNQSISAQLTQFHQRNVLLRTILESKS